MVFCFPAPPEGVLCMVNTRTMFIETGNIIEKAESLGTIKTFIKMMKKAGLDETLRGPGPFTIFAPTDHAFYLLPENDVRDLMNDRRAVSDFVKYHVLAGRRLLSSDVVQMETVPNMLNKSLSFDTGPAYHFIVNDIPVLTPDIECSNGIIHIVDSLLSP